MWPTRLVGTSLKAHTPGLFFLYLISFLIMIYYNIKKKKNHIPFFIHATTLKHLIILS